MTIRSLAVPLLLSLSILLPSACAEDEVSPPPPAPCGGHNAPQDCPCGRSGDCGIDFCCNPKLGNGAGRCIAYETFPPQGCVPR